MTLNLNANSNHQTYKSDLVEDAAIKKYKIKANIAAASGINN